MRAHVLVTPFLVLIYLASIPSTLAGVDFSFGGSLGDELPRGHTDGPGVPSHPSQDADDFLSDADRYILQKEILDLLGMKHSPRSVGSDLRRAAPPRFLLHLYRSILEREGLGDMVPTEAPTADDIGPSFRNESSFEINLAETWAGSSGEGRRGAALSGVDAAKTGADMIMGFINHPGRRRINIKHEDQKHFYFDLSDIEPSEKILEAELRLYKAPAPADVPFSNLYASVYQVVRLDSNRVETVFADSLPINTTHRGWLVFNITEAVSFWRENESDNMGVIIRIISANGEHEVLPHHVGLVTKNHGPLEEQPFMVAFFRSERTVLKVPQSLLASSSSRSKDKGDREQTSSERRSRWRRDTSADSEPKYWNSPSNNHHEQSCQRRSLFVNFKYLNFEDWIIAPKGYSAFYCQGECEFPLNGQMNATNHAIVQTLVSLLKPRTKASKRVPKACCAPKTLNPISMLYFNQKNNVVLRRHENMVVMSCGCH